MSEIDNQQKSNRSLLPLIILVILLLLANGVLIYSNRQMKSQKEETITVLETQKEELEADFNELIDELETFKEENLELSEQQAAGDSTIIGMQALIDDQKKRIDRVLRKEKVSQRELAEAKEAMGIMRATVGTYVRELEELKQINAELTQENQFLHTDVAQKKEEIKTKTYALQTTTQSLKAASNELNSAQQTLQSTAGELKNARQTINKTTQNLTQIKDTLQTIRQEKEQVAQERNDLATKTDLLLEAKELLEEKKSILEEEKDMLKDKNNQLAETVGRAAVLQSANMGGIGVRFRKNGKEVEVKRAKRAQKIRICFDVMANRVASAGNKDLLLRVVGPAGNTLAIQTMGSGVFTQKETGEQMQYSTKATIEYNNRLETYCMYWEQDTPFSSGAYGAELYHEGYLIGNTSFSMR